MMNCYELKDYCRTALPLAVWRELPQPLYQPEHRHDCVEMVFVEHGAGWCAVNGCRYPMLRGDLYVMSESDRHAFSCDRGFVFFNIMFSADLLTEDERRFFGPVLEKHGKFTFPNDRADAIQHLLAMIADELREQRPGAEIQARALFMEVLVAVMRGAPQALGVAAHGQHKHISRIFDFIARRCHEPVTLADLADELGGSPEYLGRQFKQQTGMTFSSYLARWRIDQARRQLAETDAPISEIALSLGYFDASYFCKSFRRALGVTPREYRRIARQST